MPRPEPVLDALDREMVAGRKASLREAPEAKAKLIASLSEGDSVQVTGKVKGENWYAVNRKGQTAYVVTDTLEEPATYKERKAREVRAAAEEEGLRQQAAAVAEEEERQRQQLAALAAAGQERQRQQAAARSPGSVFRDCPDCPEMVVVPAGSFMMGSDSAEQDWVVSQGGDRDWVKNESPQHRVTISRSFAVGKYEVTQEEWQSVMGANPSKFQGLRNPVEQVSWDDAQEFIWRLNAKVRSVVSVSTMGDGPYRLLTEAEWEYAARAGTTTKFSWGDSVRSGNAVCNGCGSSWDNKQTARVGSFRANAFGLYDMHGNVQEWVQDCFADSYANAPSDGSPMISANACFRVYRGGSWVSNPGLLRSALRYRYTPGSRNYGLGFRLARTLP
jgi:formylglycine-generating enzyme required for sulfatase activity